MEFDKAMMYDVRGKQIFGEYKLSISTTGELQKGVYSIVSRSFDFQGTTVAVVFVKQS